jgi:hypothetical protein
MTKPGDELDVKFITTLLVDCAQLIQPWMEDLKRDGSWSEWDQSVRDRITKALQIICYNSTPSPTQATGKEVVPSVPANSSAEHVTQPPQDDHKEPSYRPPVAASSHLPVDVDGLVKEADLFLTPNDEGNCLVADEHHSIYETLRKLVAAVDQLRKENEQLRASDKIGRTLLAGRDKTVASLLAEIERLRADNAGLREALEPFQRNVESISLSGALGHIEREHLWRARDAFTPRPSHQVTSNCPDGKNDVTVDDLVERLSKLKIWAERMSVDGADYIGMNPSDVRDMLNELHQTRAERERLREALRHAASVHDPWNVVHIARAALTQGKE